MIGIEQEAKLIEAVRKREWCYIGKVEAPMPDWNTVLLNIENVRHNEKMWRRDPNLNFQMYDTRAIPECENLRQYFKKLFHKNGITVHAYITISGERGNLGHHSDGMDVIYIGAVNKTRMNIWQGDKNDPNKKKLFSEIFESGDMIYIPKGTEHQIEIFEARVSISIGVEDVDRNNPQDYV